MKISTALITAQILLSALTEAAVSFDPNAPKFSCDDVNVNAISTPGTLTHLNPLGVDTTSSDQTILLKPIPASDTNNGTGTMCILSSWTEPLELKEQGQGFYFPLGRSVDGNDWERPPGKGARQVKYVCGEAGNSGSNFAKGEYLCQVTLPTTSIILSDGSFSEFNAPYFMTYYERSLTVRNELSRFLHKTTFGPTSNELDVLESAFVDIQNDENMTHSDAMAQLQTEWTAHQMDPSTFSTSKFSSLREYYRKRLSPRTAETYRIGESGPAACEKNSRWRKYAFTHNDLQNSQFLRWGNIELGGSYQSKNPHRITVERVEYFTEVPTSSPTMKEVLSRNRELAAPPKTVGSNNALEAKPNNCMEDVSRVNCNAKEVKFEAVTGYKIWNDDAAYTGSDGLVNGACRGTDDYIRVSVTMNFTVGPDRYDIGMFIATEGNTALTGQCNVVGLQEGTWGDVVIKEIEDKPDGCLDLASAGVLVDYPFAPFDLKCSDIDQDGQLDFDLGIVWSVNNGRDQCSMTGGVETLPRASPLSKCWYPDDGSHLINLPIHVPNQLSEFYEDKNKPEDESDGNENDELDSDNDEFDDHGQDHDQDHDEDHEEDYDEEDYDEDYGLDHDADHDADHNEDHDEDGGDKNKLDDDKNDQGNDFDKHDDGSDKNENDKFDSDSSNDQDEDKDEVNNVDHDEDKDGDDKNKHNDDKNENGNNIDKQDDDKNDESDNDKNENGNANGTDKNENGNGNDKVNNNKETTPQIGHFSNSSPTPPTSQPSNSQSPSTSPKPSSSRSPTEFPTTSPRPSSSPTSSQPTRPNILGYGDMEGNEKAVLDAWPSKCKRSVISRDPNAISNPDIYGGDKSLSVAGGNCFIMRLLGPNCLKGRVAEDLMEGDTIRISLMVKMSNPNTVFQMETAHHHIAKKKRWAIPHDDSHIVSRTLIENANEWTRVEAIHTVGPDWTFDGQVLAPKRCNHYQLRFRAANSRSDFVIDNVEIQPIETLQSLDVHRGFLSNPDFVQDHKYWQYAPTSGYVTQDEGRNVMVLKRGKMMRQDILETAVPNELSQMSFKVKLIGMESVTLKIILRMRFQNNDLEYGPCPRKTCLLYERPLRTTVTGSGSWQRIVADEFNMFGNYTDWDGSADFILFEFVPMDMPAGGELRVSDFEFIDEHTTAPPSISISPSASPTTTIVKNVGYVIRYAGEVRTVIHKPFRVEKTGKELRMDGSWAYELCELDEIEGDKLEAFPNRMYFMLNDICTPIKDGNPTVDLDPRYLNMTDLHILEMPANASIIEINTQYTLGGDLLLQSDVEDEVCSTLPSPYDNDYRGSDPYNPKEAPSRFKLDKPVFALLPDGSYALHDPRLILHENTLENPVMDGGGASVLRSTLRAGKLVMHEQSGRTGDYYVYNDKNIALCSNEQPNFLNQEFCKLSYDPNTCSKQDHKDGQGGRGGGGRSGGNGGKYGGYMLDVQLVITFDDKTLVALHQATKIRAQTRYIYAVSNLRYDSSNTNGIVIDLPCSPGNPMSRWIPRLDLTNETCTNTLAVDTVNVLKFALESSNDENEYIRDIVLWNSVEEDGCNTMDEMQYGMKIMTDEGCWENVHPDHLSVFEFTKYIQAHPAPPDAIKQYVDTGILVYPPGHSMKLFEDIKDNTNLVSRVARYGDKMIVDQFAESNLLNVDHSVLKGIANTGTIMLDNMVNKNRGGGVLVCGSPNEVAPDPELSDYFDVKTSDLDCIGCQDSYVNFFKQKQTHYFKQKQTVWALNMLEGEDQLCQRMAWALNEHLNIGATTMSDNTEIYLNFYDIFTRHCFGNYFDVLKEMVYNPKMGEQFEFIDSSSTRFQWDVWFGVDLTQTEVGVGRLRYPDENFAREIMNLYTIGQHELEPDGTEIRDEFGRPVQTYNYADVTSNARVWTGFVNAPRRGNTEELFRAAKSRFAPLRIDIDMHDFFPKTSLQDGWIGDRFPLCVDLPRHHFLKMGATFRFRGGSSLPLSQYMSENWEANEKIKRFVLSPDSTLYQKLCSPDANGDCNYANTITLDENLDCTGKECRVDNLIIVQVSPGAFYEYIRQPCIQMSFYNGGTKVITGIAGGKYTHSMCANPKTAVAARSCCGYFIPSNEPSVSSQPSSSPSSSPSSEPSYLPSVSSFPSSSPSSSPSVSSLPSSLPSSVPSVSSHPSYWPSSFPTADPSSSPSSQPSSLPSLKPSISSPPSSLPTSLPSLSSHPSSSPSSSPSASIQPSSEPSFSPSDRPSSSPSSRPSSPPSTSPSSPQSVSNSPSLKPSSVTSALNPASTVQANVRSFGLRSGDTSNYDHQFDYFNRDYDNWKFETEHNFKFEYHGELVTAETNDAQCLEYGGHVCDPSHLRAGSPQYDNIYPSENTFFWTDAPCAQQVKVRGDGMVTIVHNPTANPFVQDERVPFVDVDNSISFISVPWERDPVTGKEVYPTTDNACGNGACTATNDNHCLCDTSVTESHVFDSLPSRDDILSSLQIGAFDPEIYSDGTYALLDESSNNVDVFVSSETSVIGATSTIFKVTDEYGEVVYLKNFASQVTLGDKYTLRNPVGFFDLVKFERRDADYEVDAFLKHLIRHPSAAPFICKKLIQYFGVSNPSPAFVERVSRAFTSGSFISRGTTFGDGKHGSLAAVAAAITLDVEALSPVIDEDPVSGNIREPLLKVIQIMRSLNFERKEFVKLRFGLFDSLRSKIGQMVFESNDQFSFFSSDYSPPGSFAATELVSPESQLLSMGNVIGITNGFFSLFNYGLTEFEGGFGPYMDRITPVGDYSSSVGFLTYEAIGTNVANKIDDLSTLITAGRLSEENKQVLIEAYKHFSKAYDKESADRVLLQLMTALPEFHTSNTIRKTGSRRSIAVPPPKSTEPYKAIVYINLLGGIDSFNILTPHSDGGCTLYNEYYRARGGEAGIGLTLDNILPIDGTSAGIAGCNTFGVNSLFPALKDIYDEGKGMFMANMGHLHQPVTKENWRRETRTDLFSHQSMRAEQHKVDAFKEGDGTGVLGRMLDVLQGYGLAVSSTSVNTNAMMLGGTPTTGRLADVMTTSGFSRVFEKSFLRQDDQDLREYLEALHSETGDNSGTFANKWSQTFMDIWNKTDSLASTIRGVKLSTNFFKPLVADFDDIAAQLKMVAELIATREERGNGINRDVFFVEMGGFDTHSFQNETWYDRVPSLDFAIERFWVEMKAQGLADSVTTVVGSEFGRTIAPTSILGSDDGWGGNYFVFGGDVQGGRIVGEYPDSFLESYYRNIGRGRFIPSRSWDSLWFGVAQWFGIADQLDLDQVLPNSHNQGCNLFADTDLFNSGTQAVKACGGDSFKTDIIFQVPDTQRYLTGEEQKGICDLYVATFAKQYLIDATEMRCYIEEQDISPSQVSSDMYDITASARLNFDESIAPGKFGLEEIQLVNSIVVATASDFVVSGAILPISSGSSGSDVLRKRMREPLSAWHETSI